MNILKRTFIMVAALCCTLGTWSQQYEVGQLITLNGHNCIVVEVDSTGEHGLAAGPALMLYDSKKYTPEKYIEKKCHGDKKTKHAPRFFWAGRLGCMQMQKLSEDEEEALKTPILDSLTSAHGADNQRIILRYCETKGVDMERVFPAHYWADNLGDDWFVGGDYEVRKYINLISLNKQNTANLNQAAIENEYSYFYPLNIHTSTHRMYSKRMCSVSWLWTYHFNIKQKLQMQYDVVKKKMVNKYVEVKELNYEQYEEWYVGASFFGNLTQGGKERSSYYDPDYNWQRYRYYLAFKRF